jgi:hypothetical protein
MLALVEKLKFIGDFGVAAKKSSPPELCGLWGVAQ